MDVDVVQILATILLLGLSALFSGLTLGLLSLSSFELKRKKELGDQQAIAVYPIREKGNELLVTLLLGNVLVNAALTVMLNSFLAGAAAVVLATVLITLFGEILPQAALKKHALSFGSKIAPLISLMLKIAKPISYPLGLLLDATIGDELPTIYSKQELVKILEEHEESDDSEIEADELRIVENALNFGDEIIETIMTPKSVVMALAKNDVIDLAHMKKLHESGHSRFPVYDGTVDTIVGMLYLRDLVVYDPASKKTAKQLMDDKVYFVNEKQKLDHSLNAFIKTKTHLFIVVNEFQETVGIITIEDILEEIIGQEIVDEGDRYDDMREVAKVQGNKRVRRGLE